MIKSLLHLSQLESLEGEEGHRGSQLFFKGLALPSEDEQTTGVLLAHFSWIWVQRAH